MEFFFFLEISHFQSKSFFFLKPPQRLKISNWLYAPPTPSSFFYFLKEYFCPRCKSCSFFQVCDHFSFFNLMFNQSGSCCFPFTPLLLVTVCATTPPPPFNKNTQLVPKKKKDPSPSCQAG